MITPSWKEIEWVFENDHGTCRDIYVQETTLSDWEKLIDLLNDKYPTCFDLSDGQRIPSKIDKEYVINYLKREIDEEYDSKSVAIDLSGKEIRTHFFQIEEIDFDIDPDIITNNDDLKDLLDFMSDVSKHLDKPIILTPETCPNFPMIKIDSNRGIKKIMTLEESEKYKYKPSIKDRILSIRTRIMIKFFPKLFVKRLLNSSRKPISPSNKNKNKNVW